MLGRLDLAESLIDKQNLVLRAFHWFWSARVEPRDQSDPRHSRRLKVKEARS